MSSEVDLKHLTSPEFVAGRPPDEQNKYLQEFVQPHIESFNYMLAEGLKSAAQSIHPQIFEYGDGLKVEICFLDAEIESPLVDENTRSKTHRIYPAECRERHTSYKGKLIVTIQWKIDNAICGTLTRAIADVPIMVRSQKCSLAGLKPKEMVKRHEEAEEMGGYFIINGIEKIARMLIMPRRNYPIAMVRNSWMSRGPLFTEFGVSIRCVAKDQSATTNVLHYLTDGSCTLSFIHMKEQFFVPLALVLKALTNNSDYSIFTQLLRGQETNIFFKDAVVNMLRTLQDWCLFSQTDILNYIGERFRMKLNLPAGTSDEEIAIFLFSNCILTHLTRNVDKFNLLVFMAQKLFAIANEKCAAETPDNPMHQEILLGGHIYLIVLKDKLRFWLNSLKLAIRSHRSKKGKENNELNQSLFINVIQRCPDIGSHMESFLATGSVISKSSLGLMQTAGLAVIADKLNFMRYLSHFRCVHRGAFFTQMRSTTVRKLLPEAWGFICPVHTPDGTPCGLLNHLSASCKVVNSVNYNTAQLTKVLVGLGMHLLDVVRQVDNPDWYIIMLDGRVAGRITGERADDMVTKLRYMKAKGLQNVPPTLEIAFVPKTKVASQYPGIFLFTNVSRMIRPVKNLRTGTVEYIGTFEQVYMDIAICQEEIHDGVTTHIELDKSAMLSALATLVPYSDHNQGPRNMFQCQMAKQTMGTPCLALKNRSDNKMYRLQTPQAPLVRSDTYNQYGMDKYPLGTNAIVAVISYTGYDMEDAIIINKASYERGFCHGQIYKTEYIDLAKKESVKRGESCSHRFGVDLRGSAYRDGYIDRDGLPFIGRLVQHGEPYYSYSNLVTGEYKVGKYHHMEPAYVDDVKVIGDDKGKAEMVKVSIKLRIVRNPIIGDKFASRHGQKGILSQKWPAENMPFTESGMIPDILFNPHGFPSRMTIGMMIESMAGKSAALHGITHNCTPFIFSEEDPAAAYMGECLVKGGYNYYGNETMYSGVSGRELEVMIFIGVIYYQRLRHMVADKFQVRTTGPVDSLTKQPVQGRKRQGGIRFGEMERDALIGHGTAFLLHDRLFHCSDKSESHVCTKCGNLHSPIYRRPSSDFALISWAEKEKWTCQLCGDEGHIKQIYVPYVFKYLTAELAAMNIRTVLDVK